MIKHKISKNYLQQKLNKAVEKENIRNHLVFIETDYEPMAIITIGKDYDGYCIKIYRICQNLKPTQTEYFKTQKEVIEFFGNVLPDFMKLHNNF